MVHLHCTAEVYRAAPARTPEGSAERQARAVSQIISLERMPGVRVTAGPEWEAS
jgi:hypothetical protein